MTLDTDVVWLGGVLLLLAGLALAALAASQQRRVSRLRDRLGLRPTAGVGRPPGRGGVAARARPLRFGLAWRVIDSGARAADWLAGGEGDREQLRMALAQAGWHAPLAPGRFLLFKHALGLLGAALALLLIDSGQRMGAAGLAVGLFGLFAGGKLADMLLASRGQARARRIARSVPDALDLMAVGAEAGLPLGRLLQVVSRELASAAPELAAELARTDAELQLFNDRAQPLRHLAERTRVREVESMVSTLIQADKYGTPLSKALRTIGQESRKTALLRLEERAGRLPAQLSVPLMALILPAVLALIGAPPFFRMLRLLGT